MTLYIRQSAIKAFKWCPRNGLLSYLQGGGHEVAPDPTAPASGGRDTGTLVHAGLEAHYKDGDALGAIALLEQEHVATVGPLEGEWIRTFSLARTMVTGYIDWIEENGYDVGEETVSVEQQFDVEVGTVRGEIVHVTGKIDRVARDLLTDEFIIEDFKTVDQFKDKRWLQVDDQIQTYLILLRLQEGIVANRGRHTELRKVRRGVQSKPPFFNRIEFPFNQTQIQNHWTHMMSTIDRMVEAHHAVQENPDLHHVHAPPNAGPDCSWKCDYLSLCPLMDDGSHWRGMLDDEGLFRKRTPFVPAAIVTTPAPKETA